MGVAALGTYEGHKPLPYFIQNHYMANIVYLIRHNPSLGKKSHMSVVVDLAGQSDDEQITGLMLHAIVDRPARSLPLSTKCDHLTYSVNRNDIEYYVIGQLGASAYLNNINNIPDVLKDSIMYGMQAIPDTYKNLFVT